MYGYSFMLHTIEEQRAANCSKAEAHDELITYLDTPMFEVITDIVGWWGVSLTFLSLDDTVTVDESVREDERSNDEEKDENVKGGICQLLDQRTASQHRDKSCAPSH